MEQIDAATNSLQELQEKRRQIQELKTTMMKNNIHFREFREGKPSLLKPGAELICQFFKLSPTFNSEEILSGEDLTVKSTCSLTSMTNNKMWGQGQGLTTSREKKYSFRGALPVDNKPEFFNTVLKMADKRALIAAVLMATGTSDLFTQDVDENPEAFGLEPGKKEPAKSQAQKPKQDYSKNKAEAHKAPAQKIMDLKDFIAKNIEKDLLPHATVIFKKEIKAFENFTMYEADLFKGKLVKVVDIKNTNAVEDIVKKVNEKIQMLPEKAELQKYVDTYYWQWDILIPKLYLDTIANDLKEKKITINLKQD